MANATLRYQQALTKIITVYDGYIRSKIWWTAV